MTALPPIPSGYITDRVFALRRSGRGSHYEWRLEEKKLSAPLRKTYDGGSPNEWLRSYEDAGPREELRFLAAGTGSGVEGLLTWRVVDWNSTLWLVDIRVRERSRRRGIGSALLDALGATPEAALARGVFVETQIANFPAIQFYRSRGFEICGFHDHLYTNHDLQDQDVALYLFLETRT